MIGESQDRKRLVGILLAFRSTIGIGLEILAIAGLAGCKSRAHVLPIPVCKETDTIPLDEAVARLRSLASGRRDSWFSPRDSILIERHKARKWPSIKNRDELVELFHAFKAAHRYSDVLRLCQETIRSDSSLSPKNLHFELYDLRSCSNAAYLSGDYASALAFLDDFDSRHTRLGPEGLPFDEGGYIERTHMRADIYSLLRKDRMVMDLLLPRAWGWGWARSLELAIRRSYTPTQIVQEFDQAIENLRIEPYDEVPATVRECANTAFWTDERPKNLGWIRMFGVGILILPRRETPKDDPDRDAYIEAFKEGFPYREMYCLPSN